MDTTIVLALLVLFAIICTDLVFRSVAVNSNGKWIYTFYFYSAVFSLAFVLVLNLILYKAIGLENTDVGFGIGLGALGFLSYLAYLLSFDDHNTSIIVTIYRLNVIPSVILAVILLGETLSLKRCLALIGCVVSILLLVELRKENPWDVKTRKIMLSLSASLIAAVMNVLNKVAVIHGATPLKMLFWRFLTVTLIAGALLAFSKKRKGFGVKVIKYAAVYGILSVGGLLITLKALKTGDVSLVTPICQLSFVFVGIISVVFFKEKFALKKILALGLAVLSIILIA